ncbi:auxin-responsive protein SAUR36-like [Phoenix dactylifera]|uniref:Auxin-responsive protein SAUR36-like n=1 Tax=Phoenix dactylifera TaxID=42345 RepID=A0A8B8JBW9_PHODC|nr:auxin-responsive protein SAUR36-like [Phoenix dactylifera]
MKKFRGFRLRRRLVRIWRWAFRRRSCKGYLRLAPTTPPPSSQLQLHRIKAAPLTTKLRQWGRCLARGLGSGGDVARTEREAAAMQLLEGGGGRESPPPSTPKGHLAVYVSGGRKGEEAVSPRRFVVPVIDFNHPLFVELLREAEEEFGFHHPGGITIPCPVSRFERVRNRIAAEPARKGIRGEPS